MIDDDFVIFSIFLTLLFFLVSLGISYLAYRSYKLTKLRRAKLFTYAFILLTFSHLFSVIVMAQRFMLGPGMMGLGSPMHDLGIMDISMAAYMLAFILFFITTLKTKELSIPFSLAMIIGFVLILIGRAAFVFHGIAAILLLFVVYYYWEKYWQQKHLNNFVTFLAFFAMLVGNVLLVFTLRDSLFFTVAQFLRLLGYLLFLGNLVLVLKK